MNKILELLKVLGIELDQENLEKVKTIFDEYVTKEEFSKKENELLVKSSAFDLMKSELEQLKAQSPKDNASADNQKIQTLENELKNLKIERNRTKFENLFIQKGIKDEMYNAFLDKLPLHDEVLSNEIITNTLSLLETTVQNTKQDFINDNQLPKGAIGGNQTKMTKEDFNKLGTVERVQLLNENPTLYNELAQLN